MKLFLAVVCLLPACASITLTGPSKVDTYLLADTDPAATACGGIVNGVRIPNVPTSGGKCKIMVDDYVNNGQNTWIACNSAPDKGEACVTNPFSFKLTGPK
jgi:hypothetical protein